LKIYKFDLELTAASTDFTKPQRRLHFTRLIAPRLREHHILISYDFKILGLYAFSRQHGSQDDQEPDATSEEEGAEKGARG
jgi:hypothetical protein